MAPPEEAVLNDLGDDTDTTGAICGQLAGAYWESRNSLTHCGRGWQSSGGNDDSSSLMSSLWMGSKERRLIDRPATTFANTPASFIGW
jgi:hypothetical protein